MTTWNPPSDAELAHKAPVRLDHPRRIRDMVIALQEGDPSAPSIYTAIAAKHPSGGIGSIAFLALAPGGGNITAGSSYAGSNLRFGGCSAENTTSPISYVAFEGTTVPAGTWRALGSATGGWGATAFIRIA